MPQRRETHDKRTVVERRREALQLPNRQFPGPKSLLFLSLLHLNTSSVQPQETWQFMYLTQILSKKGRFQNVHNSTLFKNYPQMPHFNCSILAFSLIFVLSKLTCLVTLFDHRLKVYKNSPNWPFWHFWCDFAHAQCTLFKNQLKCLISIFQFLSY